MGMLMRSTVRAAWLCDRLVTDIVGSALDLGLVRARRLVLQWTNGPNDGATILFFGLLNGTSFPHLHTLRVGYSETPHATMERREFHYDPLGMLENLGDWALKNAFASQLQVVNIVFWKVSVIKQASKFLSLFGVANRKEVLRVIPSTVKLVD
jgi:hypothetical protein